MEAEASMSQRPGSPQSPSQQSSAARQSSPSPVLLPNQLHHNKETLPSPTQFIGETFAPFDHQSVIVGPFEEEANKDHEFNQQLTADLLSVTLEFYAWASARPKHEESLASARLEQSMHELIQIEKQQGTSLSRPSSDRSCFELTRERLKRFVDQMRNAIVALTGPLAL